MLENWRKNWTYREKVTEVSKFLENRTSRFSKGPPPVGDATDCIVLLHVVLVSTTVYGTTVVSSESGHVTVFQRSGTCVCGEGTFRIFGPKTISAVMLSQWENGAFLFKLIVTAKLFMLLQRYDLAHVQNWLNFRTVMIFEFYLIISWSTSRFNSIGRKRIGVRCDCMACSGVPISGGRGGGASGPRPHRQSTGGHICCPLAQNGPHGPVWAMTENRPNLR